MMIPESGGTVKAVQRGVELIKEMLPEINAAVREPVSPRHLMVALQCGGSDGYSGISANPALGAAVDLLMEAGGTAILSETPDFMGPNISRPGEQFYARSGKKWSRDKVVGGTHRCNMGK